MILLGKAPLAHLLLSPCSTSCLQIEVPQVYMDYRYVQRGYGAGLASALSYVSQNHKMMRLEGISGENLVLPPGSKHDQPELASQDHIQRALGNLPPLWATCVCAQSPFQWKSVSSCSEETSCVSVCAHGLLSPHWAPLERA